MDEARQIHELEEPIRSQVVQARRIHDLTNQVALLEERLASLEREFIRSLVKPPPIHPLEDPRLEQARSAAVTRYHGPDCAIL